MDDAEETLDYGEYDANGDDDANAGCGGDEFGYDDTDDLYGEMRQYKRQGEGSTEETSGAGASGAASDPGVSAALEKLQKEHEALRESHTNLERNISCLYYTAKAEIARLRAENAMLREQSGLALAASARPPQ